MIPLRSFLGFKKVDKEAWLKQKYAELEAEFKLRISDLELEQETILSEQRIAVENLEKTQRNLQNSQADVDDLIERVNDKKLELEKKNVELSSQIRMLEAKASPSGVWTEAFSLGFSKAWDMMMPMIYDGFDKVKQEISDNAKIETLNGLQSVLRGKNGTNSAKD